jgi:prepilin-type N-terminal cleavage/methylation domain-containing protein
LGENKMLGSLARIFRAHHGFTLVEIIVVVGIIAALSAVVIPNTTKFSVSGKTGSQQVELEYVQTAMKAMLADNSVTTITPHDSSNGSTATNDWSGLPQGGVGVAFLGNDYLKGNFTVNYYCFNGSADILQQFDRSTACTLP